MQASFMSAESNNRLEGWIPIPADLVCQSDPVLPIGSSTERDDALAQYLHEIRQVPLLTPDQEMVLGRAIARGRAANQSLTGSAESQLSPDELRRVASQGQIAGQQLTEANLRLVVSVAKRYSGYEMPLLDLIQEGNLGLMRAVQKFDYRRGFKFSTYATWWIRQSILRAVMDQLRVIRLPVYLQQKIQRMQRAERALVQTKGRADISDEEIAAELGIRIDELADLRLTSQEVASLDAAIGTDEDTTLGDLVVDQNSPSPEEIAERTNKERIVAETISSLPPREAFVVRRRFGFLDGQPQTLEKVGQELGVTRERARQIESLAIRRLKHSPESERLKNC